MCEDVKRALNVDIYLSTVQSIRGQAMTCFIASLTNLFYCEGYVYVYTYTYM